MFGCEHTYIHTTTTPTPTEHTYTVSRHSDRCKHAVRPGSRLRRLGPEVRGRVVCLLACLKPALSHDDQDER